MASAKIVRSIDDLETSVILQEYADRILILISQMGKVGNLIQASIPPTTSFIHKIESATTTTDSDSLESLPPPPPSIQLTPLFGAAPSSHLLTLHNIYASQTSTLYWTLSPSGDTRPVITGIALKRSRGVDSISENQTTESERRTFGEIMQLVKQVIKEHCQR